MDPAAIQLLTNRVVLNPSVNKAKLQKEDTIASLLYDSPCSNWREWSFVRWFSIKIKSPYNNGMIPKPIDLAAVITAMILARWWITIWGNIHVIQVGSFAYQ